MKGTFLRINTEEIRGQLKQAGLSLCKCADKDVWLVMYYDENVIHSIGRNERDLREFLLGSRYFIDCDIDVNLFIKTCSRNATDTLGALTCPEANRGNCNSKEG